ncbi:MAG: hypothetical protein ACI9DC_002984 [Gammaproteobacteria bacterium]
MNRVGTCVTRRRENPIDVKIALAGGCRANLHCAIDACGVQHTGIGLRVDRNRAQSQ